MWTTWDIDLPVLSPRGLGPLLGYGPGRWAMDVSMSRSLNPLRMFKRTLTGIHIMAVTDADAGFYMSNATISVRIEFRRGHLSELCFQFRGEHESTMAIMGLERGRWHVMCDFNSTGVDITAGMMRLVHDCVDPSGRLGRAVCTYMSAKDVALMSSAYVALDKTLESAGVDVPACSSGCSAARRCLTEWRAVCTRRAQRVRMWVPRLVHIIRPLTVTDEHGSSL
jgi:hypothetical protein